MNRFFAFAIAVSIAAATAAGPVKVADCERDAGLDYWAEADVKFCVDLMDEVFKAAGLEHEHVPFDENGLMVVSNSEVICSAFRTEKLLRDYDFPLQPFGRMHFALYTTPDRAMSMMSVKITEWPRMRIGYSPVSQGQATNDDRENYFRHARLAPEYVNIPTSAGAVEALKNGEIDALFLYTPFGKRPPGLVEVVPIGSRNVYFAVRKDRPELLAKLSKAYRDIYIDRIDEIDAMREKLLGVPKPAKRVRIAAYSRGDLFEVTPDGVRSGAFEGWMKAICGRTHWTTDYVYGDYDESLADVRNGRLDMIGGLGFAASRRNSFLYPHTPIGMLRVYLWAHPGSKYVPGDPDSWKGMKVGLLSGTLSSERAKRQFSAQGYGVTFKEYSSDAKMLKDYFAGKLDACVDVEMPDLDDEKALHVYASHPMYICTSLNRKDLFEELEGALDSICDDFPKYLRMISERHYGTHSELAALSLSEADWLAGRAKTGKPVAIDFSPWPFPVFDKNGEPVGFIKLLLEELSRKTGLVFVPQEQTDTRTAEAKFLRGDTELWFPYPEKCEEAVYGARTVVSFPVPQSTAKILGAQDYYEEFELFAKPTVPDELVSILRKVFAGIDPTHMQEMFMADAAQRQVVHRVFGKTSEELAHLIVRIVAIVLALIVAYGVVMLVLLKREARRANEAAAAAEEHAQAKTRFLAMMSHELRTPLNAVIGFAEFLSRDGVDEEKRKEYINGIMLSSNALLELINDVLDLSKLEAGAMQMRAGACDVGQLLRELPAIFGYRVRRHGVKLRVIAPPEESIPMLELSQQGLRQILINLVGNAAKFTEHGEIAVEAAWDGETRTLHLEVRDTGRGISDEKMSKLFDPFVQDIRTRMQSSSGEIKGTGLGLPIVKRMVENAKGTIHAQSTVGLGTTFIIEIPDINVVEGLPEAPRTAEKTLRMTMPDRVLVVDDMVMNRKILGIHLGNLKIKDVRFADNGEEALEVMKEWKPDLVLTDMWMPKMDGTQLAEAMRKMRSLADVPIVAVTADVDVGSTYDMSLFAKIISKPVTGDKLRALFGV